MQVSEVKRLDRFYIMHLCSVNSLMDPNVFGIEDGVYLIDSDGNRGMDYSSQMKCVLAGYKHPTSIYTIQNQTEKLCCVGSAFAYESRSLPALRPGGITVGVLRLLKSDSCRCRFVRVCPKSGFLGAEHPGEVIADTEEELKQGLAVVDEVLGEVDAMVEE